jgi:general secretion pathway protein B
MSYILDALRRADAERERGAVPNIHAQPYAAPSSEADATRATPPWLWIALALLAVAVLALAWKLFGGDAAREQVVAAAPVAATPTPMPAPASTPSVSPPPPVTSAMPPPPSPAPLQPVQPLPITPPTQAPRAAATPARAASKPAARAEPAFAAAPPTTVAAPASTPASAVERVFAVNELPEDVRRSLPALPIGGAMYSKNAADRMLIVGGQILHEGDTIAPDLKLEQIRLKSAVFRYKAYRYEVGY